MKHSWLYMVLIYSMRMIKKKRAPPPQAWTCCPRTLHSAALPATTQWSPQPLGCTVAPAGTTMRLRGGCCRWGQGLLDFLSSKILSFFFCEQESFLCCDQESFFCVLSKDAFYTGLVVKAVFQGYSKDLLLSFFFCQSIFSQSCSLLKYLTAWFLSFPGGGGSEGQAVWRRSEQRGSGCRGEGPGREWGGAAREGERRVLLSKCPYSGLKIDPLKFLFFYWKWSPSLFFEVVWCWKPGICIVYRWYVMKINDSQ